MFLRILIHVSVVDPSVDEEEEANDQNQRQGRSVIWAKYSTMVLDF